MKPIKQLSHMSRTLFDKVTFKSLERKDFNRYENFTIRHHFTTDLLGFPIVGYAALNWKPELILYYLTYKIVVDGIGFLYMTLRDKKGYH